MQARPEQLKRWYQVEGARERFAEVSQQQLVPVADLTQQNS